MSEIDLKRALDKMKYDLESWRGLIIALDSVLKWEKKYHPAVIFAVVSVFYFVLWMMAMSTLTMISLIGLICVALDFAYPSISRLAFKTHNWTGDQETQFEEACNQLFTIKSKLSAWYGFLFAAKEKRSSVFVIGVSAALLALAWVGAIMDNFLLMYIVTLSVALYPGFKQHGALAVLKKKLGCIASSKVQQLGDQFKKTN